MKLPENYCIEIFLDYAACTCSLTEQSLLLLFLFHSIKNSTKYGEREREKKKHITNIYKKQQKIVH